MQIFPSFATPSASSATTSFGLDTPLLNLGNDSFGNVFGSVMRDAREDVPLPPPLPRPEAVEDYERDQHRRKSSTSLNPERRDPVLDNAQCSPRTIHADHPHQTDQLPERLAQGRMDTPLHREDFAELREKLEDIGVDAETLDRVEDLFVSSGTVTWGQVMDVLREPLRELTEIILTPEQEGHLISLFDKIGFTPEDAKQLVLDLLNRNHDAAWGNIQEMLGSLANNEKISITPEEIMALIQALGLNTGSKSGSPDPGLRAQFGLSEESFSNVAPKSVSALQAIADAMRKAGIEMTPELRSVVHKALRENADVLQRVAEATQNGELKLDPKTLAAFQEALQNKGGGAVTLEKLVQQATQSELTPEALQKILGMIRESASGTEQDTQRLLADIQRILSIADSRDLRMQAADNGPNAPRISMTEALNALKAAASDSQGKDSSLADRHGDQRASQDHRGLQNPMNRSGQGWESFWNKINVQNSGEVSGTLLKDAGTDPRSVLGQTTAATTAENAANRSIANAPAPHRSVLNQVHSGLLQNLGQGRQQLTLQLHPADLGSLTVNLKVVGKEVQAVLRADTPEARQIIAENMPLLRHSLESQGLRVTRLDVQTQLNDQGQNQFTQHWHGSDGQKFQEQAATTQWAALGRGVMKNKGSDGLESPEQASILQNSTREGGINLIA